MFIYTTLLLLGILHFTKSQLVSSAKRISKGKVRSVTGKAIYAPCFEKVERKYCFGLGCLSILPSVLCASVTNISYRFEIHNRLVIKK